MQATSDDAAAARAGVLVVLRGNSASGKSTVARALQASLPKGSCAVIEQDWVRRKVLGEPEVPGGVTIALIEAMATTCLQAGLVVVVEGIFNAQRYGDMLARLHAAHPGRCFFYAWDLSFAETVRRHALRPQREEFTAEDMRAWYHGWQPLSFVQEVRLNHTHTAAQAAERIGVDIHRGGESHRPQVTVEDVLVVD